MRSPIFHVVLLMGIFSWIFGCRDRQQAGSPAAAPLEECASEVSDYKPDEMYSGLRDQVLGLRPKDLGLEDRQPFAVLMETGHDKAVATLVVIADGTTSLYFSNGGGVIGAGQHTSVRTASSHFLTHVTALADRLQPTTDVPLPKPGRVRFYLLSGDGIRTAEASQEDLGHKRHELSPIFYLGHTVITALREATSADE